MSRDKITGKFTHRSLIDRFWEKVDKSSECWNWLGVKSKGYGQIKVNGKHRYAHRISWDLHYGVYLGNLDILHSCDNPSCVNPKHLSLGTHKENMADRDKKGRWKDWHSMRRTQR